ncbi:hypothetical protein M222_1269 [Enterococcus faecalis AZ19]|nr:hypothetical protein HMPREF9505_01610 [Enterococcus faecalis TX0109]KAJ75034.1 hypothetical protein M222_1269 [Enterococcus faecalis AZ19]
MIESLDIPCFSFYLIIVKRGLGYLRMWGINHLGKLSKEDAMVAII